MDHQAIDVVGAQPLQAFYEAVPNLGLGIAFVEGQVELGRDKDRPAIAAPKNPLRVKDRSELEVRTVMAFSFSE